MFKIIGKWLCNHGHHKFGKWIYGNKAICARCGVTYKDLP